MGVLVYDDRDAAITYSADWSLAGSDREFNTTTSFTTTTGATATVRFIGTSISVFGTIAGGLTREDPVSSYAVDSSTAVVFTGNPGLDVQYNQRFFQSATLPAGEHTLTITYIGGGELFLDLMLITPPDSALVTTVTTTATQIAIPSVAPPGTVTVTSSVLPSGAISGGSTGSGAATSGSSVSNTPAIAGGIIGGVVLILLLGAGFMLWWNRKQKKHRDQSADSYWVSKSANGGSVGGSVPFPPPQPHPFNNPGMQQQYPSSSTFDQNRMVNTPNTGQYPQSNDPYYSSTEPSDLAYYNPDTQGTGAQDAQNSQWQSPSENNVYPSNDYNLNRTMGKDGRVRVNLNG